MVDRTCPFCGEPVKPLSIALPVHQKCFVGALTKDRTCECGCARRPDFGACDAFWPILRETRAGACRNCGHAEECHPGFNEWHNGIVGPARRGSTRYVCLDLETGGLNPSLDAILSVGMVGLDHDLFETGDYSALVRDPGKSVDDDAIAKNRLSLSEIYETGIPIEIALLHIRIALSGATFVAHNADFDAGFLRARGLEIAPVVCTMKLFESKFPGRKKGLSAASQYLGIPVNDEHDALADARRVAALLRAYRSTGTTFLGD